MKKYLLKIIFCLVTITLLTLTGGCTNEKEPEQKTGSALQQEKVEKLSQTFAFNKIVDLGTMRIRIINVSLVKNTDPSEGAPRGKIALGVEVGNIAAEERIFTLEDLEMIFNTGETTTPDLTLTSSLGGSYPPKRVQQGFITFAVKESELNSLKELKLKIPFPTSIDDKSSAETQELIIPLDDLQL